MFIFFSDGYADQFGGSKEKKIMCKQLRTLLLNTHQKSLKEQKEIFHAAFKNWKATEEQVDDVLLLDVQI